MVLKFDWDDLDLTTESEPCRAFAITEIFEVFCSANLSQENRNFNKF